MSYQHKLYGLKARVDKNDNAGKTGYLAEAGMLPSLMPHISSPKLLLSHSLATEATQSLELLV